MGRKKKRRVGAAAAPGGGAEAAPPPPPAGLLAGLRALGAVLRALGPLRAQPGWRAPGLQPLRRALHPVVAALVALYRAQGGVAGKAERKRRRAAGAQPAEAEAREAVEGQFAAVIASAEFTEAVAVLEGLVGPTGGGGEGGGAQMAFLRHRQLKPLRAALHPYVEGFLAEADSSWTARASSALLDGRLPDALRALTEIQRAGKPPKLGAVQRWVRDCMNAADANATLASAEVCAVLDAIIRLTRVRWWWEGRSAAAEPARAEGEAPLVDRRPPFAARARRRPVPEDPAEIARAAGEASTSGRYTGRFGTRVLEAACAELAAAFPPSAYSVIHREKAADRRPPTKHDLTIWRLPRGAVAFEAAADNGPRRVDVPDLPGAFVLVDVLSEGENMQPRRQEGRRTDYK